MSKFVSALYLLLIMMLMTAVGFLGMQVSQLNEKLANSQYRHQKVKVNTDQVEKGLELIKKDIAKQQDVMKEFSAGLTQLSMDVKSMTNKKYMQPLELSVEYPLFSIKNDDDVIQSEGFTDRLTHWYSLNEPFMEFVMKKSLPLEFERSTQNVVVQDMVENSVFHQMGFRSGDGIVSINGKRMLKGADIRAELIEHKDKKIAILRNGKKMTLQVKYSARPEQDVALTLSKAQFDQKVASLSETAATEAVIKDGQMIGVKLVDLQPESILSSMSLKKEDVITKVNGQSVSDMDLVSSLKNSQNTVRIDVLRDDKNDSVFVTFQN